MSFLSLLYCHVLLPVRSITVYCTRLLSGEVLVQFQPSRPNAHVVYWMGIDLLNRLKQVRFLPCVKYILRSDLTGKMRDCYSRHGGSSPLSAAKAPSSKSKTLCSLRRQCRCNSMPVPPLLTSKISHNYFVTKSFAFLFCRDIVKTVRNSRKYFLMKAVLHNLSNKGDSQQYCWSISFVVAVESWSNWRCPF